ncbi:AAA family ATPase [Vibrio campbellii]|uniref:AAA family ATPase n=1 Tax=Vibrio campbellii TaxID=680 RepID=UPI00068373D4|nr:ATP-binding protein [Vibrio campbellii]
MFEFTGREQELNILKSAWDKALQGQAQWVSIYAESGIGKTRLAYEFYHYFTQTTNQISSGSTIKGYWPDKLSLDNHDLKLNPDISQFSNDTISSLDELPSLWWGMRCSEKGRRNSSNSSSAIYDYLPQLLPHLAILKSISARQDNYKNVAIDLGKKAISMATGGVIDVGIMLYELCENLDTLSKNTYSTNSRVAYEQQRQELSESVLKAFRTIRKKQVPLVLVVDDIQFIDSETLAFIEALKDIANQKLLIITTCWAREWSSHPLAESISGFSGEFREIELSTVNGDSVDAILQNTLPGLSKHHRTAIATRSDGNLQYLYEICYLLKENPEEFFIDENPSNDFFPGADEILLSERFNIERLIKERFSKLHPDVKSMLVAGSFQGPKFSSVLLENYATTKMLDAEAIDCLSLLKRAVKPGYFLTYDRESLYEFPQRGYWEIANKRLENPNIRSSIIEYYTEQAREINTLNIDASSKFNLIHAVLPYMSIEEQLKLSLNACNLLVNMGRFKEALVYYSQADSIFRERASQSAHEYLDSLSAEMSQSIYQIKSYFPLYINSNQNVEEQLRAMRGLKSFTPFRLTSFDLPETYPEHELELKCYLDQTYLDVQSTRQLGYTFDELQRLKSYLTVQKHVFDSRGEMITSDMLFRYLLCTCRYIHLSSLVTDNLEQWQGVHHWLDEEIHYLIEIIDSGVFNDSPHSIQHLRNLANCSLQISILAWTQKSWQFYGKEIPVSQNYNAYCSVADFIADSYHFGILRKDDVSQFQSLSTDNLALLVNIEDEVHLVAAMYGYDLAVGFSSNVLERIEELFRDELATTPEILIGATNAMIGVIDNLEFGKERREQSIIQFMRKYEDYEHKPILIAESIGELPTEIISGIAKTLHAYLSRIIEEHRHTVDILIIICRLEHQILSMHSDTPTEESKLAWFERAFHYAYLANDADLFVHGEVAPFINFLASEHSKLPRNSGVYERVEQLGIELYGRSWGKFKIILSS